MNDVPPCPKCESEYTDTAFRYITDDVTGMPSKLMFDEFACGSQLYGITLGMKQSEKCRNLELTKILKVVRRALPSNAQEVAMIDAVIGKE